MNLHLLRLFATVAEQGSFSRAASLLYISQPAISKGVQELERQLGTTLLDRSGRGVALTEAGETLLPHAQHLFAVERAAETALEQLEGLERGQLAIGASSTIGIYLLPPLLGRFRQRYPGIRLFLDIGNTQQIGERLRMTPLDTVFVEGPVDLPHTEVTPWRDDTLVVIAAPDHPLAGKQRMPLDNVLAEPFVLREGGSGTRYVIEQALRERGITLKITMELGSTEAIKQVVSAGLGLAIVSEATIALELQAERLAVLDVPELTLGRVLTQLHVVGRPPSRALQAFEALLRE
ncbi:MAG TPA: LysR substrate-binding domain-containing protein [Roseiflexaceae bacterium]|jgi:DNA-binding transcriptional LysR family regulator|nr:LysR substrate-binding domain-containing protein [Roseiflexaceae bacterium]